MDSWPHIDLHVLSRTRVRIMVSCRNLFSRARTRRSAINARSLHPSLSAPAPPSALCGARRGRGGGALKGADPPECPPSAAEWLDLCPTHPRSLGGPRVLLPPSCMLPRPGL